MTARMAVPSQRAKKMHDLAPKADFVHYKARTKRPEQFGVGVARARGKSTSSAASASEIDPSKPLTAKQKAFVEHWAKGESLPSACLRAGYSDDGLAYRLARMPNILALKAQYEAKYEEEAQMTRKKVMDGFMEAIDMAKLMAEPATMVSGWREIAKMCGYMAPVEHKMKVDVTGNIVLDRMNSMSDAELLKVISQGAQHASPQLLEDVMGMGEDD
ncbi:MAG: terminase small subunit [Gammaproteobacteria bacterium]|nr:terminase small subunit [Gammaproteobacteria bacterium]